MRRQPTRRPTGQPARRPTPRPSSRPTRQPTRDTLKFNLIMLIASLILGVISWVLCRLVYAAVVDIWPRPLVIGIMFGIFSLILLFGIFLVSISKSTFEENIITKGSAASAALMIVGAVVVIVGLSAFFQWIYGLHIDREAKAPTSYVFIIDDSGSMETNDPNQNRFAAINEVLSRKSADFPYMIYSFSDQTVLLREMLPKSNGRANFEGKSSGGTAIKGVLEQVVSDYQDGTWNGGESPRVIFLTDGYATDMGWFSAINRTLKAYAKNNISISTIGLGNVDRSLMQKIAKKTGGVFIDIADVAKLGEAMESGAEQYYVDDLLTTRYSVRLQFLYGLLRVLFLTILGVCMGLASVVAYGQMESAPIIAISSLALSFVGALIMELFTSCFGISDQLSWALLWLLISATICMHRVAYKSGMPRPLSGRTSQALR